MPRCARGWAVRSVLPSNTHVPHDFQVVDRKEAVPRVTYTRQCSAFENAGDGFSDQKSQRRTPLSFLTRSERAMNGSITYGGVLLP